MDKFTTEEGWHTLDDGEKLFTKTWKPLSTPKARMVMLHGFSDHSNIYGVFFPSLASCGIEVFAFDQRGWGRSVKAPAQKGLTGPTSRVLADIASVLDRFIPKAGSNETMEPPLFLAGHSMGGAETLHFASNPLYASYQQHIRGYLALAPYLRLHKSTAPWRITVLAGKAAAKVLPHMQLVQKLDPAYLSTDAEVIKMFQADELCHDTGTLEGLDGMLKRAEDCDLGKVKIVEDGKGGAPEGKKSIFVCHGTADQICDFKGTQRWVEEDCNVQDKEWKVYEGWLHRINDQDGEKKQLFAKDVGDWILDRVGSA